MLKTLLITNWRSSLTGLIVFLYAFLPDLQKWLDQTTHVGPKEVVGLAFLILAVLVREKPSTGVTVKTGAPAAALVLMLCCPSGALAQESVPLTSIANRAHVTMNAGAMVLTTGSDWSGASLGAGLGYNLHPQFTVFAGYDHGFPINNVDESLDFTRLVASVKIHPSASVGFGYGWFGQHVDGGLVQLAVYRPVAKRLDLAAMYSHVFADNTLDDFEYVKLCLNYHLLGN